MDRVIKVLSILFVLLLLGCSREKLMTCKIKLENNIQEYNLVATYKVFYKNNFVTKIDKEETYKSDNKETIDYFNEYKKLEYSNLNNLYKGYSYSVDAKDNIVKITANIDFSIVKVKQMVINKYIDRNYVSANRLTASGAKYFYESRGADCDI